MKITHPTIHKYLESVRPPSDPILREMESEAIRRGFPYLGPQCSRILFQLVKISRAKRVFEMGSGFGYTMYWMAKALPKGGIVIGTEGDSENVKQAHENFRRGGLSAKTDIRCGDAITILKRERGPFDIIYCDIDKHEYPQVVALAKKKLRRGGLLVTDNLLWDGKVTDRRARDKETSGIRRYTRMIYSDRAFFTTIIPVRDGMSISVRL